jgi:hypothetical protein
MPAPKHQTEQRSIDIEIQRDSRLKMLQLLQTRSRSSYTTGTTIPLVLLDHTIQQHRPTAQATQTSGLFRCLRKLPNMPGRLPGTFRFWQFSCPEVSLPLAENFQAWPVNSSWACMQVMDPCVLVDCGFSARRRASPFCKACFGACLFAPGVGLLWGLLVCPCFWTALGPNCPLRGGWGLHVAGPVCCPKEGWCGARVSGSTCSTHELHAHIE